MRYTAHAHSIDCIVGCDKEVSLERKEKHSWQSAAIFPLLAAAFNGSAGTLHSICPRAAEFLRAGHDVAAEIFRRGRTQPRFANDTMIL